MPTTDNRQRTTDIYNMNRNITILTYGSTGDVLPYIALGKELQSIGYAVRIATHDNFKKLILEQGLDFSNISLNPRDVLEGDEGQSWLESSANPIKFFRYFRSLVRPFTRRILLESYEACRDSDMIIFSILGALPGISIAEKLGIKAIGAYLQPMTPTADFPSFMAPLMLAGLGGRYNRMTYSVSKQIFWLLFHRVLAEDRREILGLPPKPMKQSFWEGIHPDNPIIYGYSHLVCPKPTNWGDWIDVTGYWFFNREDDWQPSVELRDFLESGVQPIYIGFGSMSSRSPLEITNIILDALERTGQRAILATGWGGISNIDLPDRVFKVDFVPHDWLFARVSMVIHHGGTGTTGAGIRAGVPSVLIPFFADQNFWAMQIFKLGIGPRPIPRKKLNAEKLANAIDSTLDNRDINIGAKAIGEKIRNEDGVSNAVKAIQRLWTT